MVTKRSISRSTVLPSQLSDFKYLSKFGSDFLHPKHQKTPITDKGEMGCQLLLPLRTVSLANNSGRWVLGSSPQ